MMARGFILQAGYRNVFGPDGRRTPVVQLYGRLEDGGTFAVRDDRQRPHFYVRAADAARAREIGADKPDLSAGPPMPADRRTLAGEAARRIEVQTPQDVPPLRERLHASGVPTFEADVRFATRYLIERGIKGGCEIERRALVAPTVRSADPDGAVQQGGHVLESAAGLHCNVWMFDFKSLYPSIIRTLNIDPLSYVERPSPDADLIRTAGGAFARAPAILPSMLDELFPRRDAAKRAGDTVASNAIKILMNSFYGVLGATACRFYNPALVNAITGTGRELLLWSKAWFEAAGFKVLYGDTDSLFVASGAEDSEAAHRRGRDLAVLLNADLQRHVESRWRVASRLELEFEKLYLKLFLPLARHSTRGASKRYAGLLS